MGKGTEFFPDLGEHCSHDECKQLDFLPFTCDGCHKVFCLKHRTYRGHSCPNSEHNSRLVVVCEICSMSMENKADEQSGEALARHQKSGDCDPRRKQKTKCPVKRCKELLTFSNTSTCKKCHMRVCLKHRFATDHDCKPPFSSKHHPLLLAPRKVADCGRAKQKMPGSPPSVKAY